MSDSHNEPLDEKIRGCLLPGDREPIHWIHDRYDQNRCSDSRDCIYKTIRPSGQQFCEWRKVTR